MVDLTWLLILMLKKHNKFLKLYNNSHKRLKIYLVRGKEKNFFGFSIVVTCYNEEIYMKFVFNDEDTTILRF